MMLFSKNINRFSNGGRRSKFLRATVALLLVSLGYVHSATAQITPSAPALLNTNGVSDSASDYAPEVTTDGVGNWVAVWDSQENLGGTAGMDLDIFVSTSTNNGVTWSGPGLN